eukprot:TRINITY_DN7336_c0_g1_i1.p1 TRINITY_DN7336_c0_g1~~TRINITY_DN7336_c0_g1_i1.p1  ORF type:complete len:244 (+),score=32.16 TRINITY_DN7336_c0_g1_i1:101-832(+)
MIRRPPRSTLSSSSAASDVYKRQVSTQSTGVRHQQEMLPSNRALGGFRMKSRAILGLHPALFVGFVLLAFPQSLLASAAAGPDAGGSPPSIDPVIPRVLGKHLIAEITAVSFETLNDAGAIRTALVGAADSGNFTALGSVRVHSFVPHGVTGFLLLSESHMSIHTWPEHGYAAVDIFTCGNASAPDKALASLQKALGPGARVHVQSLARGIGLPGNGDDGEAARHELPRSGGAGASRARDSEL